MSGEKYLGLRDVEGTTVHTSLPLPVIFLSDRRRKVHLPFGGRRTSVHGKCIVLDCKGRLMRKGVIDQPTLCRRMQTDHVKDTG